MGNGGEAYGLALYRNWKEVEMFFEARDPTESLPKTGRNILFFSEIPYLSLDDMDAAETYGWEVPAPDLFPTPAIYFEDKVKRPDSAMLLWYEATLLAIPVFVSQHLKNNPDGTHIPVEVTVEVTTSAGIKQVHIQYPGGDLSALENRISRWIEKDGDEETEPLKPDRRATEGMLAQVIAEMSEEEFISDPDVKKAQQLMYQAWDEPERTKRIGMAKKALQISPNCADAYVLLAEEEAETAQQAQAHYKAGVDAGWRALGKDFFTNPEYAGHFWSILETRPFMRALQGLASIQWELGQYDAAEQNFRELLRLNPGDNQGIRFMLVNLLVQRNQDDQARKLMQLYQGDGSVDFIYTAALLAFRKNGDTPETRRSLRKALTRNPYVIDFLTGARRISRTDSFTLGGEEEAANYATGYLHIWRKTPGAVEWLRSNKSNRT